MDYRHIFNSSEGKFVVLCILFLQHTVGPYIFGLNVGILEIEKQSIKIEFVSLNAFFGLFILTTHHSREVQNSSLRHVRIKKIYFFLLHVSIRVFLLTKRQ